MSEFQSFTSDAAVVAELAQPNYEEVFSDVILTNKNTLLQQLERFKKGRSRKRGNFATNNKDSFCTFVQDETTPDKCLIFINKQDMQAEAILNYTEDGYEQGHLDYRAVLEAEKTVVFAKLLSIHKNNRFNQKDFAKFLEDWSHAIVAKDENGEVIHSFSAINAVRNMRIDENVQTDSKTAHFRETRSRFEDIEVKSIGESLPAYFEVKDKCFSCLDETDIKLRLSITSNDGKPEFELEIIALQALQDKLAESFAELVSATFNDEFKVLIGSFKG